MIIYTKITHGRQKGRQKGLVAVLEAAGFEVVEDQEAIHRLLVFDPTVS